MTVLPDFHSFRDMCLHLTTGGAAYRYGSNYPIYYGMLSKSGDGKEFYWIEQRSDGGSSGELVSGSAYGGSGIQFTADEQASENWVFISKEDWDERNKKLLEAYERQARANAMRQKQTGKFEGLVGQTIPSERVVVAKWPLFSVLWETVRHPFTKSVIRSK